MDSIAPLTFLPLRFTGNQMDYTVDAVPEAVGSRLNLVYWLTILTPTAYGSGVFGDLVTLPGREIPKRNELGADVYPGAAFDVSVFLNDFLDRTPPLPDQTAIALCGEMTTPFFVKTRVENAGVVVPDTDKTWPLEYAFNGCLSVDQFAGWRDQFFTTFLDESRQFLTWQPKEKWVETNQPEFLYYLVNFTPKPAELRLRVSITYEDGSAETKTVASIGNVSQYAVYAFPTGFTAIGLADLETSIGKGVHSYKVWISNESNSRLSEIRTYYVNRDYEPNLVYLLFANSLGGYDTLRCTGLSSRSLTVKGAAAQRALSPNYFPSTAELFSLNRLGEKTLTVITGNLDGDQLDYLSELTLTDEIYVVTQEGFVSLLPTETAMPLRALGEDLAGRQLAFRYAKNEVAYSNLPAAPITPARETKWVPVNTFCLINEFGIQTGLMGAQKLELRYADDNTLVRPLRSKPNVPGTEGYTPPIESGLCLVTPFVNALVEKPGTFRRNNCAADREGTIATLTIPAGTLGAETAEQLQARIDQTLKDMDTQAYANLNGACQLNPQNYTVSVPANHWHYRVATPGRMGIYYANNPGMGNAWNVQGQNGAYLFAQGTNDLDFPTNYNFFYWRLFTYGSAGRKFRIEVYVNNVLRKSKEYTYNKDGYENHLLFGDDSDTVYSVASGAKIYVRIIDL